MYVVISSLYYFYYYCPPSASKIVSIARPNQVLIGESIYNIVMSPTYMKNSQLVDIILDPIKWKYLSRSDPDSMYRVYKYRENYSEKKTDISR